jgi:signal transduction histidine kinase
VLIKDVLDYSRLSAKRDVFKPVDLNTLIEGVLTDLETAISDQNALIQVDALPTIYGDHAQLRQLFQNLISNALKFGLPGRVPRISLSAKTIAGYESGFSLPASDENHSFFLIEVTDNGIGFMPDQANLIFQVFQRLHGKKPYVGTGIGLAVVQKVVENHQGYIVAEGRPGEGATFKILLPADA